MCMFQSTSSGQQRKLSTVSSRKLFGFGSRNLVITTWRRTRKWYTNGKLRQKNTMKIAKNKTNKRAISLPHRILPTKSEQNTSKEKNGLTNNRIENSANFIRSKIWWPGDSLQSERATASNQTLETSKSETGHSEWNLFLKKCTNKNETRTIRMTVTCMWRPQPGVCVQTSYMFKTQTQDHRCQFRHIQLPKTYFSKVYSKQATDESDQDCKTQEQNWTINIWRFRSDVLFWTKTPKVFFI